MFWNSNENFCETVILTHLCLFPYHGQRNLCGLHHQVIRMTLHCHLAIHPPQNDPYQPETPDVCHLRAGVKCRWEVVQCYKCCLLAKCNINLLTSWFDGDVRVPVASALNMGFEVPPPWGKDGIDITSPAVWVEGVEGAELGEGPAVFAVPELLAGPEDDMGCFLFLPVWFFEALIR